MCQSLHSKIIFIIKLRQNAVQYTPMCPCGGVIVKPCSHTPGTQVRILPSPAGTELQRIICWQHYMRRIRAHTTPVRHNAQQRHSKTALLN